MKRGHNRRKYNWHEYAVGDARTFAGFDDTVTAPPYVAAMKYGARNGCRLRGRKVKGGVRVERIA